MILIVYYSRGVLGHPFTAFTVVFSQAITTLDLNDLNTLSEIVAIMERAKRYCSKITRLHHVCSVLYNVAKVYVEDRLAKVMDGRRAGNNVVNGDWMANPFLGDRSGAVGTAGNDVLGHMNNSNNNGLFATSSDLSTSAATETATNNESAASKDPAVIAATGSDPASLSFVGSGSGISNSAAAAMPGGGPAGLGNMGNINSGPSFGAGAGGDTGTGVRTNIEIGGGRFLDNSSISMMEMGGSPTFGWLPTGQNMVSLLDTDMDIFDI